MIVSPLLPPNATAWSFSFVTLFYNALSVELQESIRLDGYILPNNLTLATLSSQTSTLQALREKICCSSQATVRRIIVGYLHFKFCIISQHRNQPNILSGEVNYSVPYSSYHKNSTLGISRKRNWLKFISQESD